MTDTPASDSSVPPEAAHLSGEPSPKPPRRFPTLRWQVILLLLALALIIGTAIYMLRGDDGSLGGSPPAAPRDIPLIEGRTYTEAAAGAPVYVNPLLATSRADRDLSSLLYSGLTRIDEFGQPVPDLAESWEVTPDGLTYTFHLRSDATWHDGEPFTANDVAFTMSLLRDPDFPGPADLGEFWRTVETYAIDDTTIEFVLTQPLAAFPEYAGIGILPAHLLGGIDAEVLPDDSFNLQPVGTGRLWWESIVNEDEDVVVVTLRPNDRFYDSARRVALESVIFRFYPEADDAFRALGPGAQGYAGLSASQLEAALSSAGLSLYSARLPVYGAVIFNQANAASLPFFQDERVRYALWLALDRAALVSEAFGLEAVPTNSTILPASWAYNAALPPIPHDPTRAAQLLDEAGWVMDGSTRAREGQRLAFTLLVSDTRAERALAEGIRDAWRAVGVDVTVEPLDAGSLLERLQSPPSAETGRAFDAALVEFSQGLLADPDPYAFWHDSQIEGGQNYSGFADNDVDEALELARRDPNGVRRAELYRAFQQRFIESGAAVLLYNPVYHYAVSCQVQGVQLSILVDPSDRFNRLHAWRILSSGALGDACPAAD
jgi:peptide/nickel transport system substrate-binding protein